VSSGVSQQEKLPPNWTSAKVGALAELLRGVSYKKHESSSSPKEGYVPIVRASNINGKLVLKDFVYVTKERVKPEQLLRKGDIVLAMSSGSKNLVGKSAPARSDMEIAFGAFCGVVRPSKSLDHRYLHYFFQSDTYRRSVLKASSGSNINNLRREHVLDIDVPLAPRAEQERVVEKIEELFTKLDAGADYLTTCQILLDRYRQSIVNRAVEGALSKKWREEQSDLQPALRLLERILAERHTRFAGRRYREPTRPTSDVPQRPCQWTWATLDQLSWHSGYGTSTKCSYDFDGTPVLRIPNVQRGELSFDDLKFASREVCLKSAEALEPGDLLIIRTNGSRGLIGRSAVVKRRLAGDFYFASYLIRYRLLGDETLASWIQLLMSSTRVRQWIEGAAATSAGQYNISMNRLNGLTLELPPLKEQKVIIREVERLLSAANELERLLASERLRSNRLRQSILQKAFKGELISPWSENG
jgi:type I restriction enzyme S subunit